jgi:predicted dehydrogenase
MKEDVRDPIAATEARRRFLETVLAGGLFLPFTSAFAGKPATEKEIRVGIIGLSVHSADFTEILNGEKATDKMKGCRVMSIYHPKGNDDVEFSAPQLNKFTEVIRAHGVEFVSSIDAVVEQSDAVMLLTNDGRPHLEQILPVLKAGKPVFIDKPVADTFGNVWALFRTAKEYGVPVFSSSALRYGKSVQEIAQGTTIGKVLGADAYGPAPLQPSHVDLFWDGIHAVETLFTVMGRGCESVSRTHTPDSDVVVGTWTGNRLGTVRGLRGGRAGFGGTAYGENAIAPVGGFQGYAPLVEAIVDLFRTKKAPVSMEETLEIYAFMEAAEKSKRQNGARVNLADVLKRAK